MKYGNWAIQFIEGDSVKETFVRASSAAEAIQVFEKFGKEIHGVTSPELVEIIEAQHAVDTL